MNINSASKFTPYHPSCTDVQDTGGTGDADKEIKLYCCCPTKNWYARQNIV